MVEKGFTLVDAMVSVAVVGILAAIAMPAYHTRIAKAQSSEAIAMMDAEKAKVVVNLTKKSSCSEDGKSYSVSGKYGSLAVSGTVKPDALSNSNVRLKTGCNLTYTFASSGVSTKLKGKKISAELFNNNILSKATSTNVNQSYLPPSFSSLTEDTYTKKVVVNESAVIAKDTTAISTPPPPATTGKDEGVRPNGEVVQADWNVAINVLARLNDNEISRYTPYKTVRRILQERTDRYKSELTDSGSSYTLGNKTLTECELVLDYV